MSMSQDLTSVQPGQMLYLPSKGDGLSRAPRVTHAIVEVIRLTETLAVCRDANGFFEHRIRLADGKVLGDTSWIYARAAISTSEILEQNCAERLAYKEWKEATRRFADLETAIEKRRNFTTAQMNELADVWDRVKLQAVN